MPSFVVLARKLGWNPLVAMEHIAGMVRVGFGSPTGSPCWFRRVTDFASASKSDTAKFGRFFRGMLERGIYLAPSQFEALFAGLAHEDDDIDATVKAAAETLAEISDS